MGIKDTLMLVSDDVGLENVSTNGQDSVTKTADNDVVNIKSPFEVDHVPLRKSTLKTTTIDKVSTTDSTSRSNHFLFWILLFACALLAVVLNIKAKSLQLISASIFNENMLKLYSREEVNKRPAYIVLLYIIFWLNLSVYLFLVADHWFKVLTIFDFFKIASLVMLVYMFKHLALYVFGQIFLVSKSTALYSVTILIFNLFAGIILIPFNFIIAFGPEGIKDVNLWISIIILLMMVFLRTLRGVMIVSEYLTSRMFQIFNYLCAFEIAPALILIKAIIKLV